MNKSIIVGRLGRDPEVRTTQSGIAVCNLAVATDDREKKGGEWVKVTDWHQVVCFGNDAEFAGKYLTKGSSVAVEGKAKRRKYTDKNGAERESFEIVADRVEAVGAKPDGGRAGATPMLKDIYPAAIATMEARGRGEHGPRPAGHGKTSDDFSDEVPF